MQLKIAGIDYDLRSQLFDEVKPLEKIKERIRKVSIYLLI